MVSMRLVYPAPICWTPLLPLHGRWENDRMEGEGVHVCAEGSRYEGQLRANYRHGKGRCQWGNRHDTPFRYYVVLVLLGM